MEACTPNWFIAWAFDAQEVAASLRGDLPPGLLHVDGADLHITLAFLGRVAEVRAHNAWQHALTLPCPIFRVVPRRLVALGNPRRPSAFGAVVDDAEGSLAAFIGQHRDALRAAAGVEAEARAPLPHLTLARPPRAAGADIRERAREWVERTDMPTTTVELNRLALYTRAPDAQPSRFQRVAERWSPERGSGPV